MTNKEKELEREVAMLRDDLRESFDICNKQADRARTSGGSARASFCADRIKIVLDKALSTTQATAEAYERRIKAEAINYAADKWEGCDYIAPQAVIELRRMADELEQTKE